MNTRVFDVVVLGSGIAGLQAATAAAAEGSKIRVAVITYAAENSWGGCSYKTHGTNAAMNPDDSPKHHAQDTWEGGGKIGNIKLVERLAYNVPKEIGRLESLGVRFDKATDGKYAVGYYGGSTKPRSIHHRDMAGRHMVEALAAECQRQGVHIFYERQTLQLDFDDSRCRGVYVLNRQTGRVEHFLGRSIVTAQGGGACVYPIATIARDKTAAGIVQAYEAGATIVDMEMVQFHPTGLNRPGLPGHGEILEEELRSMGAQFFNADGRRYMFDYHPLGERATRDIVSRGSYTEIMDGRGTPRSGVTLDFSGIDRETLLTRFPFMSQRLRSYGVDILTCSSVEVSPAAHFLMGGIQIDENAKTAVDSLYACGEDAGGIHGGNRLGGNGVADALVFGTIAGRAAASDTCPLPTTRKRVARPVRAVEGLADKTIERSLSDLSRTMWAFAGPKRNSEGLAAAETKLFTIRDTLRKHIRDVALKDVDQRIASGRVAFQKLMLASMIIRSAALRGNSVGAHFRDDDNKERSIYNVLLTEGLDREVLVRRVYSNGTDHNSINVEAA